MLDLLSLRLVFIPLLSSACIEGVFVGTLRPETEEPLISSNFSPVILFDGNACRKLDCARRGFGFTCCTIGSSYDCCPTRDIEPVFKPSNDVHWFQRFSLWNMWYFWFIVVLIPATCFTGCNYWRRQRGSDHFRLFQRQYTTISSNGLRSNESNGGPQIVIPITMYEVSPDTILRLMRENASYHTTASSLSSSGFGSPRYHRHVRGSGYRHSSRHSEDRALHQGPPSYGEVTSKPSMYPPKTDDYELPSYESVSQGTPREQAAVQQDEEAHADHSSEDVDRRFSL